MSIIWWMMKITGAMDNAYIMTEKKVERFLEGKLNLQLASVDEMGDPNIQPVGSMTTMTRRGTSL
jgi:hypothetical protein